MKGAIDDRTEDEKDREYQSKLKADLEDLGTHVIAASPKKIQTMRHQASQLASTKNMDLEEIESLRKENEERLKVLEEMYISKKTNSSVGGWIRDKMGFKSSNSINQKAQDFGGTPKKSERKVRIHED